MFLDSLASRAALMSSSLCDELESESPSKSKPVVVEVISPKSNASWRADNACSEPRILWIQFTKRLMKNLKYQLILTAHAI